MRKESRPWPRGTCAASQRGPTGTSGSGPGFLHGSTPAPQPVTCKDINRRVHKKILFIYMAFPCSVREYFSIWSIELRVIRKKLLQLYTFCTFVHL